MKLKDEEIKAIIVKLCAKIDKQITIEMFWDCDCESKDGYQHRRRIVRCPRCGMFQEDAGDSLAIEVLRNHFIPRENA